MMTPPCLSAVCRRLVWLFAVIVAAGTSAFAQTQQLAFAGLRSSASQGQADAIQSDPFGNLYVLLDQKDGVRLLKMDNAGSAILAQTLLGAQGDIGLAMALDAAGNVYVAGTTTSTTLSATGGAAFPTRTDASTNSFVARFDANLNPVFVTFTGGSRIVASSIAVTADAVFVSGSLFSATLPATANAIQQTPAQGSTQNGFVERFSLDGGTLVYATYLTGSGGNTAPAAIVADAADNAYIAGYTSASGLPTQAAVVPAMIGSSSGFLLKLSPAGNAFTFSTFIPGAGLSSLAFDASGTVILASGSIDLGQMPVDTVATPLVPDTYQVLLRMPLDGSAVLSSTLLAPGVQSYVATDIAGAIWVDGDLAHPLLPFPPLAGFGQSFAVRLNTHNAVDQSARFGGLPTSNPTYAGIPLSLAAITVDLQGEPVVAGQVQPGASSSLLATETYDLPLYNSGTPALPSTVRDATVSAVTCGGSLCAGSAAYIAKLNPNTAAPSLTLSADTLPFVTLRNLGSASASGVQLSGTGISVSTNCLVTLDPGAECAALLTGGPGSLTASASNAQAQTITLAALPTASANVVVSPRELDFGIQTALDTVTTRTITVANLGEQSQTFSSTPPFSSLFTQTAADCVSAGSATAYTLAPGGTCHLTLAFTASSTSANDGWQVGQWTIGSQSIRLTGYSKASALSLSAGAIDFGTQYSGGLRLPRYLYLSNNSRSPVTHTTAASSSPFSVTDACPPTLPAQSVCRLRIDYLPTQTPSSDSTTLTLDQGLSILITGQSSAPPATGGGGGTNNPGLTVTPTAIIFPGTTPVTGVASTAQPVIITNAGQTGLPLTLTLTGDFADTTNCGAILAGGTSCSVLLSFAPTQTGVRQGLLTITSASGTAPAAVSLTGTATSILPSTNQVLDQGSSIVGQLSIQWYKISQQFPSLTAAATGPYTAILVEDIGYGHGQPPAQAFAPTVTGTCLNCFLGLQFLPLAAGSQPGTLTLSSTAGGVPYTLALTGSGISLTGLVLTPTSADFGTVPVNSTSGPTIFTVTNLVPSATSVALNPPSVTGDFVLGTAPTGGATCRGPLAFGASCYVSVLFSPTAQNVQSGTLTLTAGSTSASAALTGSGAPDPGVALNPTSLTFSNVPGATATQQTVAVSNTGPSTIQIGTPILSNSSFTASSTCATLAPGASCLVTVTFQPGNATVTATLQLPVTQSAGQPVTLYPVPLTGAYTVANAGLEMLPSILQYGPAATGTIGSTRQLTLNNLTATPLTIQLSMPRQFVLQGAPCTSLAANASCTVTVGFLPATNASISGTILAQGTPVGASTTFQAISYAEAYGLGSSTLSIAGSLLPGAILPFGQVTSGQSATQTLFLTNNGSTPLNIRRLTSLPPFITTSACNYTLTHAHSCAATVTYSPVNQVPAGTAQPRSTADAGTLTIESDATSSPDVIQLTGQAGPILVASPINTIPLESYIVSQGSLSFPATALSATSAPQTLLVTNTGQTALHFTSATSSTPDFTVLSGCATLLPGATCTLAVSGSPQSLGLVTGTVQISSDAGNGLDFVSLIAIGGASDLVLSPVSLDFGQVAVSQSATKSITVTNDGIVPATFTGISVTGDYAVTGTCPAPGGSLAASATCTLSVTFTPTANGTRPGALAIASSAYAQPLTVPLTGIGFTSRLQLTPAALDFGSFAVGASTSLALTLTNTGSVSITNITVSLTGDYAVTLPCTTAALAPGSSCPLQITFTPTATGPRPGTLTVTSSATNSPYIIQLSGTGIAAGNFTITVDGGPTSTVSVVSGAPATYALLLTPEGNFTGNVALTCTPIISSPYVSCSLLASLLTLSGGGQAAAATLNTVTSIGGNVAYKPARLPGTMSFCLLIPGLFAVWFARHSFRGKLATLTLLLLTAATLALNGCGGSVNKNLRYTPAGTYQYQVSASATGGLQITHTVTLNLIVH